MVIPLFLHHNSILFTPFPVYYGCHFVMTPILVFILRQLFTFRDNVSHSLLSLPTHFTHSTDLPFIYDLPYVLCPVLVLPLSFLLFPSLNYFVLTIPRPSTPKIICSYKISVMECFVSVGIFMFHLNFILFLALLNYSFSSYLT